jgi:hypothetical protein
MSYSPRLGFRSDLTEAVNKAKAGNMTEAEVLADLDELAAYLRAQTAAPSAEGRFPKVPSMAEAEAGGLTWESAFPALTDEVALGMISDIVADLGWLMIEVRAADDPLGVEVRDALRAFQGGCWDDQHDGGAHKQDLIDVNRIWLWYGPNAYTLLDPLAEVLGLEDDEARP